MSDARCIHHKRFPTNSDRSTTFSCTLSPPSLPPRQFSPVWGGEEKICYTCTCVIATASLVAILYLQVQSFSAVKQHLQLSERILLAAVYFKGLNWIVKYLEKGFNVKGFHVIGLKTGSFAFTLFHVFKPGKSLKLVVCV